MSFLVFLIFGLIAGAIAKMIMPGSQGGGWLSSLILGVIGSWVGGLLGSFLFGGTDPINRGFFSPIAWIFAIVGALICLYIWGMIQKKSTRA